MGVVCQRRTSILTRFEMSDESQDVCKAAPHGQHAPDLSTITLTSDGGEFYLDVNCQYCGTSGCIAGPVALKKLTSEVSW